jgi:hypothetical protein
MMMSFPRGRGKISTAGGKATIVARCPLCGNEHRYEKGAANGEEIEAIRKQGYTDEWLPCQADLPGTFWRVVVTGGQGSKGSRGRPRSPKRG